MVLKYIHPAHISRFPEKSDKFLNIVYPVGCIQKTLRPAADRGQNSVAAAEIRLHLPFTGEIDVEAEEERFLCLDNHGGVNGKDGNQVPPFMEKHQFSRGNELSGLAAFRPFRQAFSEKGLLIGRYDQVSQIPADRLFGGISVDFFTGLVPVDYGSVGAVPLDRDARNIIHQILEKRLTLPQAFFQLFYPGLFVFQLGQFPKQFFFGFIFVLHPDDPGS